MPLVSGSLEHALEVAKFGFAVFPLRQKQPFRGSHGFKDAVRDPEAIKALWGRYRGGDGVGIATGEASGIWGLDVDVKDGRGGNKTLGDLERQHGLLPRTPQVTTPTGGRHFYFEYEPGVTCSAGKLGDGLDVRGDGGYLVAAGSLHPRGGVYAYKPGHHPGEVAIAEAPAWLTDMVVSSNNQSVISVEEGELTEIVEKMLSKGWTELPPSNGRRRFARPGVDHESASWYPPDEEWPEGRLTVWSTSVDWPAPNRTYGRRASDNLLGAIEISDLERSSAMLPGSDELPVNGKRQPTLPAAFWQRRPVFAHIHQAARSRMISPDALLGAVLARVCLYSDYRFVLPATIARLGSLNLFVALVGNSGIGKGGALDQASDLLGDPELADDYEYLKDEINVGSGEGMIHAYTELVTELIGDKKTRQVRQQVRQGLLVRINEVETLEKLSQRSGQTTMQVLREAFSGERLGQTYADEQKKVSIPAHAYRMAVVMAVQPKSAGFLFDESEISGGTPQRFAWFATFDPDSPDPDNLPEHPGKLAWNPPKWDPDDAAALLGGGQKAIGLAKPIIADIRRQHAAKLRGQTDELDGHFMLVRLKVAGLLAFLDGRLDVNDDDWDLAEVISDTSRAVRDWTRQQLSAAEAKKARASDQHYINRTVAAESAKANAHAKAVERVATTFQHYVKRHGPTTRGQLRTAIMARDRALTDEALQFALDEGWLAVKNDRYVIAGHTTSEVGGMPGPAPGTVVASNLKKNPIKHS